MGWLSIWRPAEFCLRVPKVFGHGKTSRSEAPLLKRIDWPLLALSFSPDAALSPVQIQKVLFLVEQNLRPSRGDGDEYYTFKPYNYGPFDVRVYEDLAGLRWKGLVEEFQAPGSPRNYRLTSRGKEAAVEARDRASSGAVAYLSKLSPWARSLSFAQLVRKIYELYPDYKVASVFTG